MTLNQFVLGEAKEKDCSFFALYAGLRMYKEWKDNETYPEMFSISASEAYVMLQDLKKEYPERFADAEKEYESEVLPKKGKL